MPEYIDYIEGDPLLLPCHCCGNRHPLMFQYYIDKQVSNERFVEIHYHLIPNRFLERVVSAIRILFGLRPKFGDFAEIEITEYDAVRLRDYLNEFLREADNA